MANCTFNASNWRQFPFQYRYPNGSLVLQGMPTVVPGASAPVCLFNTTACATNTHRSPDGAAFSCCELNAAVSSDVTWYPLTGFIIAYVVAQFVFRYIRKKQVERAKARGEELPALNLFGGSSDVPTSACYKGVLMLTYLGCVVALVMESSIMPRSIQQTLAPSDRAAHLAMDSFLTPVGEIFAFLEDSMTVKVGYALATGRFRELNLLLHISVIGGFLCALVAFGLMVLLSANPHSAEAILNPSAASNQALIDGGCTMIPTTDKLLDTARIFWIVSAASWLPNFVNKGLFGLFIGTGNIMGYLIPMIISASVPIALWFGLLALSKGSDAQEGSWLSPLSILGVAYGVSDWLIALSSFVLIACSSGMRNKYRLRCLCRHRAEGDPDDEEEEIETRRTIRSVIREGLELMAVDLAVQLSLTISIYVAASQHFDLAYKLSATQAAYWAFGPQYMVGTMLFIKMLGAKMVASGYYYRFIGIFGFAAALTFSVMVGAIVGAYMKREGVAYDYGQSACIFASSEYCLTSYEAIFDGSDSLADVFVAFGPTVGLQLWFILVRAGLAMCHDFTFMARAACSTFVLVFVPAICVARFKSNTALSYYVAMYLPHFVLIAVFGWRLVQHLRAMLNDRPGPWTQHAAAAASPVSLQQARQPLLDPTAE